METRHTTNWNGKSVVWRLLGAADKIQVTDLSVDVYEGTDYLPAQYDRWLDDPDYTLVGAEFDGKIQGFWALRKIDNGKTRYSMAARVAPQWRSHGLSAARAASGFPPLSTETRVRYTRIGTVGANIAGTEWTQPLMMLRYSHQALHKVLQTIKNLQAIVGVEDQPACRVSTTEGCTLLERTGESVINFAWTPYENTVTNTANMFRHHVFYSSPAGVSLGNEDARVNGVTYYCTVVTKNAQALLAHLRAFLEQDAVMQLYPWFFAFIPTELAVELIPVLPPGEEYLHGRTVDYGESPAQKKATPKL
eukprot:TRINITY_DN87512_c0_g1_i1.p1 TRINITY_DN87512_c0_g1~~TRINITY_DN87512_c0_g1_i1.p1  ORF type:complete len:306 (-),score=20.82 TRINITY_DN87512_c0_g1_i1:113-1030(-)